LNPANRAAALANTVPEMTGGWLAPFAGALIARNGRRRYGAWRYTPDSLSQLEGRMRENLAMLSSLLDGRSYLVGKAPTIGDVAAFAQLAWMRRYAEARLLDDVPAVARWMSRLDSV